MGNASQINCSRNSVRVERRSDLNESDLSEVYCITILIHKENNIRPESASDMIQNLNPTKETPERNYNTIILIQNELMALTVPPPEMFLL